MQLSVFEKLKKIVYLNRKIFILSVPLKKCFFIFCLFLIVQVGDFNYILPTLMEEGPGQIGENIVTTPQQQDTWYNPKLPLGLVILFPASIVGTWFVILLCLGYYG